MRVHTNLVRVPQYARIRARTRMHSMTNYFESPSRVQAAKLRLIPLQDFGPCEQLIQCVGLVRRGLRVSIHVAVFPIFSLSNRLEAYRQRTARGSASARARHDCHRRSSGARQFHDARMSRAARGLARRGRECAAVGTTQQRSVWRCSWIHGRRASTVEARPCHLGLGHFN